MIFHFLTPVRDLSGLYFHSDAFPSTRKFSQKSISPKKPKKYRRIRGLHMSLTLDLNRGGLKFNSPAPGSWSAYSRGLIFEKRGAVVPLDCHSLYSPLSLPPPPYHGPFEPQNPYFSRGVKKKREAQNSFKNGT